MYHSSEFPTLEKGRKHYKKQAPQPLREASCVESIDCDGRSPLTYAAWNTHEGW